MITNDEIEVYISNLVKRGYDLKDFEESEELKEFEESFQDIENPNVQFIGRHETRYYLPIGMTGRQFKKWRAKRKKTIAKFRMLYLTNEYGKYFESHKDPKQIEKLLEIKINENN